MNEEKYPLARFVCKKHNKPMVFTGNTLRIEYKGFTDKLVRREYKCEDCGFSVYVLDWAHEA
jgi:hypothetical protein